MASQTVFSSVTRPLAWKGIGSILYFKTVFLDDRIGENFLGNALELLLCFLAAPTVEVQDEEFTLSDVFHGCIPKPGEGVMNGLSLRVEYGAFWHDPDVCFHGASITLPRVASCSPLLAVRQKCVFETHFGDAG